MISMQPVSTGEQLRHAFGCFPSGVAAVCSLVDGVPVGSRFRQMAGGRTVAPS